AVQDRWDELVDSDETQDMDELASEVSSALEQLQAEVETRDSWLDSPPAGVPTNARAWASVKDLWLVVTPTGLWRRGPIASRSQVFARCDVERATRPPRWREARHLPQLSLTGTWAPRGVTRGHVGLLNAQAQRGVTLGLALVWRRAGASEGRPIAAQGGTVIQAGPPARSVERRLWRRQRTYRRALRADVEALTGQWESLMHAPAPRGPLAVARHRLALAEVEALIALLAGQPCLTRTS
ncbi:MAG: hypothetical protein AAGA48_06540, partial [Myxococcota bacterium]